MTSVPQLPERQKLAEQHGGITPFQSGSPLQCLLLGTIALAATPLASAAPPTLLPDTTGRIDSALCVVNSARNATLRNAASTGAILRALPARTSVRLFTNDREAFEFDDTSVHARVTFADLPAEFSFTIWPQDPFLVLTDREATTLLLPAAFPREDDRLLAEHVAKSVPDSTLRHSLLTFEGGNLTASESHVFIGADTITANALRLKRPVEAITALFEKELGRPVVTIGTSPQVVGHLDLFLTPLGGKTVLLADPRAGADLAAAALEKSPTDVLRFENDCHANFFAHPAVREVRTIDGETIRAPRLTGQTRGAIANSRAVAPRFDAIAASLTAAGFTVHRLPILLDQRWTNPQADPNPGYPILTWNNVLLETHAGSKSVYLPRYGFPALDHAAEQQWKSLGWTPIPIPKLTTGAMYGGALRCATKVLRRK